MCWAQLNNSELQAMRKLLMLDVSEAAEWIGNVTPRTWQRWESGDRSIPSDIDMEIYGLIQIRNKMIDELTGWQVENHGELLKMKYYHTFEQFEADHEGANRVTWRIHQAAVSFVFSEGGEVELI